MSHLNMVPSQVMRKRASAPPKQEIPKSQDPIGTFTRRNKGWMNAAMSEKHKQDQLAYIHPYKSEYQPKTPSELRQGTSQNGTTDASDHLSDQFEQSCAASCISEQDSLPSLVSKTCRPQRFGIGAPTATNRSSVMDFERTSTILPPTELGSEDYTSNVNLNDIRREFFSDYKRSTSLPIYKHRSNVINSINSYSVVIIEGATGCGKTTQVPCYILEDAILDRRSNTTAPVIYVTQPRRIAARSIAQRVCDDHNWTLGSIVGYQIGLEKVSGPQTILTFCTAGVLLQKLIQDKSLANYSHIIIDEAHERDADTDLLMMMIRTLMRKEMSFFRLIIMSATMDINKLRAYYTFPTSFGHRAVTTPSLCLIGQEKQPSTIQIVYYDDLRSTFKVKEPMPMFDLELPEVHDESLNVAVDLIVNIIPHIDTYDEKSKSTLVFLPGLAEIGKLHRLLSRFSEPSHLDIIPLHSCLASVEQTKVFKDAEPGFRKVILATNIAESSITVRDVGFIIDFCLTKTLRKDPVTRFPTLKLQWSTADKCTQRAGRTGRCCNGKVFRLVSRKFYKTFKEYADPELLVAPLELSVLRVKNFQMGEIKAMFAVVLDPPPLDEIRTAVLELKQIGALSSTYNGVLSDLDGDLTELGRVISSLPIDVHLSKLIVMASILDVLEDAIIVAACLSTNRTVVKNLYGDQLRSYISKLEWANGSHSDLFVCLDIYKRFASYKDDQMKTQDWLERDCKDKNLDNRKLHEVSALVMELKNRLEQQNIVLIEQPNRVRNRCEDELMLKVAFCASFYPNYFITEKVDVQEVKKALCGLDPTKTVIVHNLPINQVPLYRSQIVNQFNYDTFGYSIDYIADNSRALLIFDDDRKMLDDESSRQALGVDGIIAETRSMMEPVYLALKKGECEDRLYVREYSSEVATQRMKYYQDRRTELSSVLPNRLIPSWIKIVQGRHADNTRLIDATDEEYCDLINENFFIEIELNETQDTEDLEELAKLAQADPEVLERLIAEMDAPTFKADWRLVRGPYSPIALTFRSVLEKSKGYSVEVDSISINSIILDPDYEKGRRQMLIGASVCQSKRGKIVVRDTTLMPNIRGLPTLMALLFAQYYKVIYNDQLQCIAGALFGLGWDENDEPIDRQYEVELGFDVQISGDDIKLINKAREICSELLRFIHVQNPGLPQAEKQRNLRNIILTLMRKRRFPVEEISFDRIDWSDGNFILDKHNIPETQLTALEEGDTRVFLPVMVTSRTYNDYNLFQAVRANLDMMGRIELGQEKPPIGGLRCLLCGSGHGHLLVLRNKLIQHVNSDSHIQRLVEFEIFEERARQRFIDDRAAASA